MKVFELYSGIGGMHFALNESNVEGIVMCAADINTTANAVYRHNFPDTNLIQRNIQSLTPKDFNGLEIDFIMMSPPCQPYTRLGLQKDDEDSRNDSLLHIIKLIPQLTVKYILLENVKGFEESRTRQKLIDTLVDSEFHYQEFLISPTSCYIPNSRLRYYLLAKKVNDPFCFDITSSILRYLPKVEGRVEEKLEELSLKYKNLVNDGEECFRVEHVLCPESENLLPEAVLERYAMILDIVTRKSDRSCCFTKGYYHYIKGTGSVFTPKSTEDVTRVYKAMQSEGCKVLQELELRFFSPKEILKLMCFPDQFQFPLNVTLRQRYQLLGNSINVHVVSLLTVLLVS